jgi:hypothetical protein
VSLETRYRRLLALYPAAHRDLYEEEMVAVLLADAAPGQTRPGSAETLNLVASAVRERARYAGTSLTGTAWRDAAAVVGTFLPILLLLKAARFPLAEVVFALRTGGRIPPVSTVQAVTLIGWSLLTLLAVAGWRLIAAIAATGVVVTQVVDLAGIYYADPITVLYATWSVAVGVLIAGCLGYGRSGAPLRRTLRVPARIAIGTGTVLALLWPVIDNLIGRVVTENGYTTIETTGDYYGFIYLHNGFGAQSTASALIVLLAGIALIVTLTLLASPVRRRVFAIAAPAIAMLVMIMTTFDGFVMSSVRFNPPVLLVAGQWVALVGVPAAAFSIAALLVHRRERTLELIALGRATRRANPGASHLTDAQQSAP